MILVTWVLGFGFANGSGNAVIGTNLFVSPESSEALLQVKDPSTERAAKILSRVTALFPQVVLAFYSTSLVSSGGLERSTLLPDLALAVVIPLIILPLPLRWCRPDRGWLAQRGYTDDAGGGVVHVVQNRARVIPVSLPDDPGDLNVTTARAHLFAVFKDPHVFRGVLCSTVT